MAEPPIPGIEISSDEDRVVIEIAGGRWEGTAAQAERVLTGLHYALARARPGTNIGSMFLNGTLWGGKFIEPDEGEAALEMRNLLERLEAKLDSLTFPPQDPLSSEG